MGRKEKNDMSLKSFVGEFGKKSKFLSISKLGKVYGFLHPNGGYRKRTVIGLNYVGEDDKGKRVLKYVTRLYTGDDDPLSKLKIYLKQTDAIDNDDIVLHYELSDGKVHEISKGDILDIEGYDWQKRIRPKTEFLFPFIDVSEGDDEPSGPVILPVPISAGKKLKKDWQEEFEDSGEAGDPWLNPYPFRITYDSSERGTDMYSVKIFPNKKPSDEVKDLFDEDPPDLDQYADLDREDHTNGTTFELLKKYLVISCPVFDTDIEEEAKEEKSTEPQKQKVVKKTGARKVEKKETVKPTPPSKPGKPKSLSGSRDLIFAKNAEPGVAYLYVDEDGDREVLKFVKLLPKNNKVKFKDEEGGIHKLHEDVKIKVYTVTETDSAPDHDVPEDDTGPNVEQIKVSDCQKSKWYYTEEGKRVRFKSFKAARNIGLFRDENNEKVKLSGDLLLSEDVETEGDPLAGKPRKKADKDPVQETKPDEKDSVEEVVECPECGKGIPVSAIYEEEEKTKTGEVIKTKNVVCPYCKTGPYELELDDDDDVNF